MNTNKLSPKTMNFRKRFHLLNAPMKFETAAMLGQCFKHKQMPTGRPMAADEIEMIAELLEWCNDSILFNRKPNGGYDEYFG